MVLKKSAAVAAVAVIAAAGVAPAAEFASERMNVQLPVVLPTLSAPVIPAAEQAVALPSNIAMPVASISAAQVAAPAAQPAAIATLTSNPRMAVINGQQKGDKAATLSAVFENGSSKPSEESSVSGAEGVVVSGLSAPAARVGSSRFIAPSGRFGYTSYKASNAGTIGDYLHRAINVVLGWIGLGLHKAETPEVLAQRLMDELNAEGPKLNTLVAQAGKQVELLRMQVANDEKESTRLNGLADQAAKNYAAATDPAVKERLKTAAMSLDTQKTQLDTGLAVNKEQLAHAEAHLKEMKQHRDDFFYERQQKMAAIRSKLSQVQAAKMDGELAKLEASFKVGDHKDVEDAFNRAADEQIAEGKGKLDAAQSSPEEQLKEIERSARHDTAEDSFNERLKKLGKGSADAGKAGTVGDYLHRFINVVLGWIGLGLHKAETPELLAQRLMDELNAEGPKLNTLVAGASKQVELLRMQVANDQKESDRLNGLADAAAKRYAEATDPAVKERLKTAAMSLDTQKTQIDTSLTVNKEQLAHAEAHLKEMKQKRDDFFYERQQKMAAIRSKLSQVQAAKMDGELAKLEASFKVGDHKDLNDAFNRAADEQIAEGKGKLDAAQSSPEEQLKEIERSARHDGAEDSFNERLKKLGQKDSK